MFAIIEFAKHKCAIIPMIWLIENKTKCYWPRTKSEELFNSLVLACSPPENSWALYDVDKILFTGDDYAKTSAHFEVVLAQSTSSDPDVSTLGRTRFSATAGIASKSISLKKNGTEGEADNLMNELSHVSDERPEQTSILNHPESDVDCFISDGSIDSWKNAEYKKPSSDPPKNLSKKQSSDNESDSWDSTPKATRHKENRKRKKTSSHDTSTKHKMNRKFQHNQSSDSEDSDKNNTTSCDPSINGACNTPKSSVCRTEKRESFLVSPSNRETQPLLLSQNYSSRSSPSQSARSTPLSTRTTQDSSIYIKRSELEHIYSSLEALKAAQDQQSVMLGELLRTINAQNAKKLVRPNKMPPLPITDKKGYRELEEALNDEAVFEFLKRRLSIIGGQNVRHSVMNMMKYLLTNQVAMKFNWAGREKRPFKNTNMMKAIREAAMYAYSEMSRSDLNEDLINKAVKDWLKLAKQRFEYKNKQK
ncbi:uncharacterized protein LOC123319503 [Coccinella septempunctata]|uniref:uncharacterized protein LOC123319503 n=1 Tax=Coccinella septempunctata TaxID=41139 RepID=UPI001D06831B|nr:uncharacterized protein LOC123319503 [Coccinella septempunctata]